MVATKEAQLNWKDTNPKDAVGTKKVPYSCVPSQVVATLAVAMLEGARKYGRHNYRVAGVRGSVYFDAAKRHLDDWWEGQDIDPDSELNHIIKAMASLTVLYDAITNNKLIDDRPPRLEEGWILELNKKVAKIVDKYPEAEHVYIEGDQNGC